MKATSLILTTTLTFLLLQGCGESNSSASDSNGQSGGSSSVVGKQVTAHLRGSGGGVRLQGRIEDAQGDRVKVTLTYVSPYPSQDLAPYGYASVYQGDTVWTPKGVWSIE